MATVESKVEDSASAVNDKLLKTQQKQEVHNMSFPPLPTLNPKLSQSYVCHDNVMHPIYVYTLAVVKTLPTAINKLGKMAI